MEEESGGDAGGVSGGITGIGPITYEDDTPAYTDPGGIGAGVGDYDDTGIDWGALTGDDPSPSQPSGGYNDAGQKTGVHTEDRGSRDNVSVNYGGGDTGFERSDSGREGSGTGGAAQSGEAVSKDHDWSAPSRNKGGPIYRAGGGFPGEPRGTDTVPAWLTDGEFVTNKPATEMFGKDIEMYNNIGRKVQDPNVTVKGGVWEAMHELDRLINMAAEGYWKGGKV